MNRRHHHPNTLDEWYSLWWDRIFKKWLPCPSREICIVIFCGGECGGDVIQHFFQKSIPKLYFHNMREFHEKYSRFDPPLRHSKKKTLFNIRVHDIFMWLSTKFQRLVIIDIFRCPIQRALYGFYRYPQSSLCKAKISSQMWRCASFAEKSSLFERNIFPNIERRHGLDTEYQNELCHLLSSSTLVQHVPSFPRNIEFLKLRYQDKEKWLTTVSQIFPNLIKPPPLRVQTPHLNLYETSHSDLQVYEFIKDYIPQLPFLHQVLHQNVCQRYFSKDEIDNYIHSTIQKKLLQPHPHLANRV